jgi:tetratricopeptide (TPR) repeat protein
LHKAVKKAKTTKKIIVPALTNVKKYQEARSKLDEVIATLEEAEKTPDKLDPKDLAEVRSELSDSYGMKGGILRREGKLEDALSMYEKGLTWEQEDSTYNLSNSIVLSIILKRQKPDDHEILDKLKGVIKKLEKQVDGPRRDEWWAWADLAQFYLLCGDLKTAMNSYRKGQQKSGPSEKDYKSSIAVLTTLKNSIDDSPMVIGITAALKHLKEAADEVAIDY